MDPSYISNFEFYLFLALCVLVWGVYMIAGVFALIRLDEWLFEKRWPSCVPTTPLYACLVWLLWPVVCVVMITRVRFYQRPGQWKNRRF